MQRILMIGPFPDPISGVSLANQVVKDILIQENKFKVQIINTSYPYFDEKVGKFSFQKFFFFLSLNFKVFKVFKNQIIYITPGQTFFGITKYTLYILIASIFKKELIIHVHGNHLGKEYELLRGIKKRLFYYLNSQFTKGIVLSDSLKNNLIPFVKEESIFSLPNFAENYLFETENNKDYDEMRVVYLSNLMKEKGIISLLHALKEMEGLGGVLYRAKIAGNIDDDSATEIQNLISELQNCEYIGVVKGEEKKELLNWGNVFVLPTFYKMEGQPISILESLATGNVIITTKHAGIPDIIQDGVHGYFVKKNSSSSLAESLLRLYKNKDEIKRIGLSNKRYFLNNFTISIFRNKLLEILSK